MIIPIYYAEVKWNGRSTHAHTCTYTAIFIVIQPLFCPWCIPRLSLAGPSASHTVPFSALRIITWIPFPVWFSLSIEGFGVITDYLIIEMGPLIGKGGYEWCQELNSPGGYVILNQGWHYPRLIFVSFPSFQFLVGSLREDPRYLAHLHCLLGEIQDRPPWVTTDIKWNKADETEETRLRGVRTEFWRKYASLKCNVLFIYSG